MIIVIKTEVERKDKQQFMLVLLKKNVTQLKFISKAEHRIIIN
jgi:hypothetical protein